MTSSVLEAQLSALEQEARLLEETKLRLETIIRDLEHREGLRDDRDRLTELINTLRVESLQTMIAELRQAITDLTPHAVGGYYTFLEFLNKIVSRVGYIKGAQTDYAAGSQHDGDDVKPVDITEIYKWHAADRVPAWAYEQIDRITYPPRVGATGHADWTTEEVNFLVDVLLERPSISNKELSSLCTEQFHRPISENAIRGMITRRRQNGRVPQRRPGRS